MNQSEEKTRFSIFKIVHMGAQVRDQCSGEGAVRGNKILWTKDSLGADMNILIWKFTNKHQEETDPYLLLAGIILVKIRVVPIQPNRNTTKSTALAWRT